MCTYDIHMDRLGADGRRVHHAYARVSTVSRVYKVVLPLITAHIHSHLFESKNVAVYGYKSIN